MVMGRMIWNLVLLVSIPSVYAGYIGGRLFILTTYRFFM